MQLDAAWDHAGCHCRHLLNIKEDVSLWSESLLERAAGTGTESNEKEKTHRSSLRAALVNSSSGVLLRM
jgi:hypothetical protein